MLLSVPVPGGRIAVQELGSGPPVVFVHGGTGNGLLDWGAAAERLARRHRTVVFDLRGHGRSLNDDGPLGVVRFGLDLRHVLAALGIPRAALVGFSVGGNTLLKLLARDPRPALALVTVGAAARGNAARVEEILSGPWPGYLRRLVHEAGDGPDYWQTLRIALANDWARNLALSDEEVRRISCPTLVVHGADDVIQELEYGHHLAETLPHAELLVVPAAGHAVQLDHPELFLDAVEEFLGRALARQ